MRIVRISKSAAARARIRWFQKSDGARASDASPHVLLRPNTPQKKAGRECISPCFNPLSTSVYFFFTVIDTVTMSESALNGTEVSPLHGPSFDLYLKLSLPTKPDFGV